MSRLKCCFIMPIIVEIPINAADFFRVESVLGNNAQSVGFELTKLSCYRQPCTILTELRC